MTEPDAWTLPARVTAKLPMGSTQTFALALQRAGQATLEAPRQTDLPTTRAEVLLHFAPDRLMAFAPDTEARIALHEVTPAQVGEAICAMR